MGFLGTETVPRKGTSLRKGVEVGGSEGHSLGIHKVDLCPVTVCWAEPPSPYAQEALGQEWGLPSTDLDSILATPPAWLRFSGKLPSLFELHFPHRKEVGNSHFWGRCGNRMTCTYEK